MDTTEQYSRMYGKAKEIQAVLGEKLPSQDQLQEMLITPDRDFLDLLDNFYWSWAAYKTPEKYPWRDYVEDEDKVRIRRDFTSIEQLWLAFVMFELYHKKWCNSEWIKED